MADVNERDIIRRGGSFETDDAASWHPLVVVAADDTECWVAVCTDAKHRNVFPNSVNINSADGGFSKNTIAICDKVGIVKLSDARRLDGHVDLADFMKLTEAIDQYQGLDNLFEDYLN